MSVAQRATWVDYQVRRIIASGDWDARQALELLAAHLDAEVSPAGWRARDYEPVDGSSGRALLNSDGSWTASVRRDGRSGYADGETAADAVGAAAAALSHEGEGE